MEIYRLFKNIYNAMFIQSYKKQKQKNLDTTEN